jgi:RHS repeat-associated protein
VAGYTGHHEHRKSGLWLTWYRAYDPETGRWLSRDPLENAEFLQGPNLYSYVGNSPTTRIDPDGRFWQVPVVVGGLAYLGYKVYKACKSLDSAMDKATEERKRRQDAIGRGDYEHSGVDPNAFNDISKDIVKGAGMPGTSVTGPARNPGPAFPALGRVPLPVK